MMSKQRRSGNLLRNLRKDTLDWDVSDRRIFSIAYQKRGEDYYVEVGKPDPRNGELVVAILESMIYLICTPNRGVLRGMPLLIAESELTDITDFSPG